MLIYEEPCNELIRTCLRLECLFEQIDETNLGSRALESHAAILALFDLLKICDRSDFKAKLSQELQRQLDKIMPLIDNEQVDTSKLNNLLGQLEQAIHQLRQCAGKLGQPLRENEFLNYLSAHLTYPSTAFTFDTPAYHYWLQQSATVRRQDINQWVNAFAPARVAVHCLLHILRERGAQHTYQSPNGVFQLNMETSQACQLVRIYLPKNQAVFPKISAGRNRVHIQFYSPTVTARPQRFVDAVAFDMTICV